MRLKIIFPVLIFIASAHVFAQTSPLSKSLQAIVVTTKDWKAAQGTARLFERKKPDAKWKAAGKEFPVVVGKRGLGWSIDAPAKEDANPRKIEGDGKAPAGIFNLTYAFGSTAKADFIKLPYTQLTGSIECVDDVKSSKYNLIVDKRKVGDSDWKSSEKMLAVGEQYDLGVFVAHNSAPPKAGNGSCIFLHIWKNNSTGTAGCTAMSRENIETVLRWLEPQKNPVLVQMTSADYVKYRNSWKLPKLK